MIVTIDQIVKRRTVQLDLKSVENLIHSKGEVFIVDSKNTPKIAMVDFKLYSELMGFVEHVQDYVAVTKARSEPVYSEEAVEQELGISLK